MLTSRLKGRSHQLTDHVATMGWLENMTLMVAPVLALFIAMPLLNPPPKNTAEKANPTQPTPFYLELRWGDKLPHDLDTYVTCSTVANGELSNQIVVNYKQTHDGWLTLDHDSTGYPASDLDLEIVKANSTIEHVPANTMCLVNAHLFDRRGGNLPLAVHLLAISEKDSPQEQLIANFEFPISEIGEECTVLRVEWDETGHVRPASTGKYPDLQTFQIATAKLPPEKAPTCTEREHQS